MFSSARSIFVCDFRSKPLIALRPICESIPQELATRIGGEPCGHRISRRRPSSELYWRTWGQRMPLVLISYSREDRDVAASLAKLLEQEKFSTWWDWQIIGGTNYRQAIGGAIARKFAAEGFTVFAGRRNGNKLVPLVQAIETAGGRAFARSLDARPSPPSCARPMPRRRSRSASSTLARTSTSPWWTRRSACSARCGRWPAMPASSPAARQRA